MEVIPEKPLPWITATAEQQERLLHINEFKSSGIRPTLLMNLNVSAIVTFTPEKV
ncbi:MAG: hypothetical protein ABIZ04_09215 [Opitutus sp.]